MLVYRQHICVTSVCSTVQHFGLYYSASGALDWQTKDKEKTSLWALNWSSNVDYLPLGTSTVVAEGVLVYFLTTISHSVDLSVPNP